jgi:hypothetical protein
MEESLNNKPGNKEYGPLAAIGIFLSIFGVAVISGIFWTVSTHGKIVNILCGGILLTVGITAFIIELRKK